MCEKKVLLMIQYLYDSVSNVNIVTLKVKT